MPSVIPGYEYDIFVSYRHNDNLDGASSGSGQGWVTDFVQNLEKELKGTLKDPVTIYFDKNPHDGLLETHSVDKSLEGKLKCLIFIPIISQTYCDPKSFAWQHEFCAFNKLAKEDAFGRDVKVSGGNVASRILPIKIHDLDADDKATIENEMGGVLRAIEFIYKEAGVNRPLKSSDTKTDNLNRTDYRNQVNKAANAIKEIITSLKNPGYSSSPAAKTQNPTPNTQSPSVKVISLIALGLMVLMALLYTASQFMGSSDKEPEIIDKSIAVLPFVNMSNDPEQEYFSDGLSEELIDILSKIPDLKVIARPSSFSFKGKNEDVREIGKKLDVAHLLYGSVRKSGLKLRIHTNLIQTNNGTNIWSKTYDYEMNEVFKIQEAVARDVVTELRTKLALASGARSYDNNEVYDLLLHAKFLRAEGGMENTRRAIDLYHQALAIDSLDARVWSALAFTYDIQINMSYASFEDVYSKSKQAALRAIELDNNYAEGHRVLAWIMHSHEWDNWAKIENAYQLAYKLDPGNALLISDMGLLQSTFGRFEKAEEMEKKAIELDPMTSRNYARLARVYLLTGRYQEALATYKKALEMDSSTIRVHAQMGKIHFILGDIQKAAEEANLEKDEAWRWFIRSIVYFHSNQKKEAEIILNKLVDKYHDGFAYQIASVFAMRNEKNQAFEWLDKSYRSRDGGLTMMIGDPFLKSLESDPRYEKLLKKMNFTR